VSWLASAARSFDGSDNAAMENLHGFHYGSGGDMPLSMPTGGAVTGARGTADISTILDQIMNITDQSLDEAQVVAQPRREHNRSN
jgi:hypothetical protein